jgi:AraC-like DNA-binding protein
VRSELAAWWLTETQLPIERIAEKLGYQDTSNFSRTFRRWFGMPPLAMRKEGAL